MVTKKLVVTNLGTPSLTCLSPHHDLVKLVRGLMTYPLDRFVFGPP